MNKNTLQKLLEGKTVNRISLIFFLIIIAAIFIVFYELNKLFPIYIDDWDYSFVYYTDEWFSSFFDIVPSMKKHYTMWGGRLVVHTILQELLLLGPFWHDLLNALMFIGYILLIYFIANRGKAVKPSLILLIFLLTWFFQADLGETVLWLTGSANYLWGTSIILAFLYPYYSYYTDNFYANTEKPSEINDSKLRCVLFFVCGIVAGWTNENMVAALVFMILIFLFIVWKAKHKIAKWTIWGLAGVCLGGLLMYAAPGNFKRLKVELGYRGITDGTPGIGYYLENLQALVDGVVQYLAIPFAIYAVLIAIYLFVGKPQHKKERLITSFIFSGGFLVATLAMVASPVFPPRAWFGVISLVVIAISVVYAGIDFSGIYIRVLLWVCIICGCVLFVKTYTEGRDELVRVRAIVDDREVQVKSQKAEGKKDVVVKTEMFDKREDLIIPKMYDFPKDTTHWMFQAYKHYHELNTIRLTK